MSIPFNKPYLSGNELDYIKESVETGKISGDGVFTKRCQEILEEKYGFGKTFLTTSCTDALEMAAILCEIQPGDEIIMPSYTFVSTANAFILRGAKIIFADSEDNTPNINADTIEALITPKTKVIVPVHYAGVSCDMGKIMPLAHKYKIFVVEDAAQAIDSYYKDKPLGSIGDFGAFSFHETKNVIAGEGGMLAVNNRKYVKRAEIIREKGTNRSAFFRGEIDKYGWVDLGSSFLPSDITAAFLFAQLESINRIQEKRKLLWEYYYNLLKPLEEDGFLELPEIPEYATNNAHLFYIVCQTLEDRSNLIQYLRSNGVHAVFHYLPLHKSSFFKESYSGQDLPNSERYAECLLRLPLYFELSFEDVDKIVSLIFSYYKKKNTGAKADLHISA